MIRLREEMRLTVKSALLTILFIGSTCSSGYADPIVSYDPGVTYRTQEILSETSRGKNLVGMRVTAIFDKIVDNANQTFTETGIWSETIDTPHNAGAVTGSTWGVSLNDTSYMNPWIVTWHDAILKKLLFEAETGGAAFDLTRASSSDGTLSTLGTQSGITFEVTNSPTYITNINATYSNLVAVGSSAPVGDLYSHLSIMLTTSATFGSFSFKADTDKLGDPVPEPATMLLFGTGLAGLAGTVRMRKLRRGCIEK